MAKRKPPVGSTQEDDKLFVPSQAALEKVEALNPGCGKLWVSEEAERLRKLVGLVSYEEGLRLAYLAKQVPEDQAIVELGSFKGKSAAFLASTATAPIHCFDLWTKRVENEKRVANRQRYLDPSVLKAFKDQTRPYAEKIRTHQMATSQGGREWTGPKVGLLWIDAAHDYESVREDVDSWFPHLASQAVVAFDDPFAHGVIKVINELNEAGTLNSWERNGKIVTGQYGAAL